MREKMLPFHGGKAAGTADDEIKATSGPFVPDRVMASIQEAIRVKHYSLSTERTYLDWARRFFDYTGNRKGGHCEAGFRPHLASQFRHPSPHEGGQHS